MTEGVFAKRGRVIVAVDSDAEAMLLALPDNKDFVGEFRTVRNIRQHRLWWALMQKLADNNPLFDSKEHASDQIKLATGHFKRSLNIWTGELTEKPLSIKFASLRQEKFNELFQRACDVIVREFLPGVTSEELRDEIERMIDGEERHSLGRRVLQ
jgi:hypothetical protein